MSVLESQLEKDNTSLAQEVNSILMEAQKPSAVVGAQRMELEHYEDLRSCNSH